MVAVRDASGRHLALTRRGASWCLLLFAQVAPAHNDHTRHPTHPEADTILLNLQQAIELGSRRGPDAVRSRATRASANDLSAAAAPLVTQLPYVQTQVGPRLFRGNFTPEVVVSVNQPFTWGDTSGVQRRVARATVKAVDAGTRNAQLVDARRAALAWVELALADRVLKLRQEYADQARALVTLARARVTAGEAQPMELALAEGELSEAESLVIDAEGAHYAAELELSYAIGKPGAHVDVEGTLTSSPLVQADAAPVSHPEIAVAESRAALALEQVEYAKLQQAPTMALGLQYQREGTGDQILTAVATIPLPVAEPWAFQQTQQRMTADAARADVHYARLMKNKELAGAHHELEHARSLHQHLERAGVPPLREAHRIALLRYSEGATDFSEVSLIRQRLLRGEERVATALAQVLQAHVQWLAAKSTLIPHGGR